MSYFYVKSSLGTCVNTDGALTKQTGAFGSGSLTAGNVYSTLNSAITNGGAGAGDFIMVSVNHAESTSSTVIVGPTSGDYIYIISVSDTACETPTKHDGTVQINSTGNNSISGRVSMWGVYMKSTARTYATSVAGSQFRFVNGKIESTMVGEGFFRLFRDALGFELIDSELAGTSAGLVTASNNVSFYIRGCTTTGITGPLIPAVPIDGMTMAFVGCDLSSVTGDLGPSAGASPSGNGAIHFTYQDCKTSASATLFPVTLENLRHQVTFVRCSDDSTASEYQFAHASYGGTAEEDTAIYRDETVAIGGSSQKMSIKVDTSIDLNATVSTPFMFELPARWAVLSAASTDTLRIYVACANALTDVDIWADVIYPDGTNKQTPNYLSSQNADPLGSGTALTTDSGSTWKASSGASDYTGNEYYIDLDTSADVGADCSPLIRIYVAAQETIYLDPVIDTVA